MVSIGSYLFPADKTFYEVKVIEAKSKVRKEIHIASLIQGSDAESLQQSIAWLQSSVEAFDNRKARLSLHEGRFYEGRRRTFKILPDAHHQLAFVKLILFSFDRFERSFALHQTEQDIYFGFLQISVWNQGNWQTLPKITVTPGTDCNEILIQDGQSEFRLEHSIPAQTPVLIDSSEKSVYVGEEKIILHSKVHFPALSAGRNQIEIRIEPSTTNAKVLIQHQDIWV